MSDNKKDKKNVLCEEDLSGIAGGYYRKPGGTWIPVDENCPAINSGEECDIPGMKGHYGNCHSCKHYNG